MGDECMSCTFPDSWQMIEEFQCPTGYKETQENSVCTPIKNSFCCTVAHSGVNGDCEDVVVNDVEQKCAFVEDINKCGQLPANWNEAEENEIFGSVCPSLEYEWLEDTLDCGAKIIENDIVNQKDIIDDKQQKSNIVPVIAISAVIIILMIILWFFLIKRRQK